MILARAAALRSRAARSCLVTLVILLTGLGEGTSSARRLWHVQSLSPAEGLAQEVVHDVLVARDGSVWFAMAKGLTRFDPALLTARQLVAGRDLPRHEAMALAQTPDGAIWVATGGGGVARYGQGKWTWFTKKGSTRSGGRAGLPSDFITSLLVDRKGRLWARPSSGGLVLFDGKRWHHYPARGEPGPGEIGRCAELRSGPILCGTREPAVLWQLDGSTWSKVIVDAPVRWQFYVHAVAEADNGDLWLATEGAGAIHGRKVARGYRFRAHNTASGLPSNSVVAVHVDADRSVWAATSSGVMHFDGQVWRSIRGRISTSQVVSIRESASGVLWFATLGSGAFRCSPSRWEQLGVDEGLASNNLTGGVLVASDGSVWVGTDLGINVKRNGSWQTIRTASVDRNYINHLAEGPGGTIWVSTRMGVSQLAEGQWTHFSPDIGQGLTGPAGAVVNEIAVASEGSVWMATDNGISQLKGARWQSYGEKDGLPSVQVSSVVVDRQGAVWAITAGGVVRLAGSRWQVQPTPAGQTLFGLHRDARLDLWLFGLKGAYRYHEGSWRKMGSWDFLPQGIFSRYLLETTDRSSWFAVRGSGVLRYKDGLWTRHTSADGLNLGRVRQMAALADGSLLFATIGSGLIRHRLDRSAPETLLVGQDRAAKTELQVMKGESLVVTVTGRDFLLDTPTGSLRFSHRLDRGRWSPFSSGTLIQLDALPPGEHLLEVRAMDQELNVDRTPAALRFVVVLPWWERPRLRMAMAGTALLLGLLLTLCIFYRVLLWRVRRRVRSRAALRRQSLRQIFNDLTKQTNRLVTNAAMTVYQATLQKASGTLHQSAQTTLEQSKKLSQAVEGLNLDQLDGADDEP